VNLTTKQKATKEELSLAKLNQKAISAMQIRENFQRIYAAESTEQLEGLLNSWYYWATHKWNSGGFELSYSSSQKKSKGI